MLMLIPPLGHGNIPAQVKLVLAILITVLLHPTLLFSLPVIPETPIALAVFLIREIILGLMFGFLARIMIAAVSMAGAIISLQSGLASASMFDPSQGEQSLIIGRFMSVAAFCLLFISDTHHLILKGIAHSYALFQPGSPLMMDDFSELATQTMVGSFLLAIQLSSPFLVYGLIFNIGLGLVSRLMPMIQVFFIAQPLSIFLSLNLLAVSIGLIMVLFTQRFAESVQTILGG